MSPDTAPRGCGVLLTLLFMGFLLGAMALGSLLTGGR